MVDDDTIDEMRTELERAAEDLERVTAQLRERSDEVERLEALLDTMLGLLDVPVVVVGPDRRVAALSRGAAEVLPENSKALGKAASSVLPRRLADRVVAFADGQAAGQADGEGATEDDSDGLVALPGGATLVVLGE
jgi:nitrogen fixation/metabolism regulation signal transduction histidine kinase